MDEPVYLLRHLLESMAPDSEVAVVSNLVRNVISGAAQADRNKGLECLEIALGVQSLSASSIEFLALVGLDDALMQRAIEFVRNDTVEPHQVSAIAFNNVLQSVDESLIEHLVKALLAKQAYGAWAAIDFQARVLYRTEPKGEKLLQGVKASVINPFLFDKPRYTSMDWYYWCDLVEKLFKVGQVDSSFSIELLEFIISVTAVEEYNVQLTFDGYAQKILRRLIAISPRLVWEKYHEARTASEGRALYRLPRLFETSASQPSAPGVLNDIPADIYVPWMLEEKEERMPFILDWIQLFVDDKDDRQWNADFVSFIDTHVDCPERLNALRSRLITGMWYGSFSNKLEAERDQLLKLREASSNSKVHRWIDRTVLHMEQQIVEERRQDANREASYRA